MTGHDRTRARTAREDEVGYPDGAFEVITAERRGVLGNEMEFGDFGVNGQGHGMPCPHGLPGQVKVSAQRRDDHGAQDKQFFQAARSFRNTVKDTSTK